MSTITNSQPAGANGVGPAIQTATTPVTLEPLWPNNQKLEIIGVTGPYESGKTLFICTIDPTRTIIFDTEKSSASYEQALGFTRVDLSKLSGKKPIELFQEWHKGVQRIQPGRFRVGGLDTVSEIESGLADWVWENPSDFGHTRGQYEKMEGLYWGDVKEYWKRVLTDLSSRFETFAFSSHLRQEWSGNRPTGKQKPKGKETLMELASLYLWLERTPDAKGNVPVRPSGRVLKSRLVSGKFNAATGEFEGVPILPPRLPEATPMAIRRYMLNPPDYTKLKAAERLREEQMSSDERLLLETSKAEFERDAAQASLSRVELMRAAGQQQMAARAAVSQVMVGGAVAGQVPQAVTSQPVATSQPVQVPSQTSHAQHDQSPTTQAPWEGDAAQANTPQDNDQTPPTAQELLAQAIDSGNPLLCTVAQRSQIIHLRDQLAMPDNSFMGILARRNAKDINQLTREQADSLIETLKGLLAKK